VGSNNGNGHGEPIGGFTPLALTMNLDEMPWSDIDQEKLLTGMLARVGVLPNATTNGKPIVALYGVTDDGTPVVFQTTWNLMHSALVAFEARYGPAA
jgi:hypothetical protein